MNLIEAAVNHPPQRSQASLWSTQVQVSLWRKGDYEARGRLSLRFSPLVRHRIQIERIVLDHRVQGEIALF